MNYDELADKCCKAQVEVMRLKRLLKKRNREIKYLKRPIMSDEEARQQPGPGVREYYKNKGGFI